MEMFDHVITKTATREAPWYAIPADDKWYTRYLFSEILIDVLEKTKPAYPEPSKELREQLDTYRRELEK